MLRDGLNLILDRFRDRGPNAAPQWTTPQAYGVSEALRILSDSSPNNPHFRYVAEQSYRLYCDMADADRAEQDRLDREEDLRLSMLDTPTATYDPDPQ